MKEFEIGNGSFPARLGLQRNVCLNLCVSLGDWGSIRFEPYTFGVKVRIRERVTSWNGLTLTHLQFQSFLILQLFFW